VDLFSERFEELAERGAPLASRMRPRTLDDMVGQEAILGPGTALRGLIERDEVTSVILWGPPGTGKTSLARVIAGRTKARFEQLSAVTAGVKDVREVMERARENLGTSGRRTILFIDEIHRFNKAQQDALLPAVERRTVVLIGATTENPFFEVNAPLMSRSLLFRLEPLSEEAIGIVVDRALADRERGLGALGLSLEPEARAFVVSHTGGDARLALNGMEIAALGARAEKRGSITLADAEEGLQRRTVRYDKGGQEHFDVVSAFIKSLRGSDPDASLHWLARMLAAGEDARFIARRMVIFASEDVGLADPRALVVAVSAAQALEFVGLPEARLNLAQAAIYLATAPKSNSVIAGIDSARNDLESGRVGDVPTHLRDSSFPAAKRLGHGVGYKYPHSFPGHHVEQAYLPEGWTGRRYYVPSDQGEEARWAAEWRRRSGQSEGKRSQGEGPGAVTGQDGGRQASGGSGKPARREEDPKGNGKGDR